ncbi:peptidyl-prolyl cis-trans isomerase FKBP7 [Anguilla rostrata]|uniref:peptidylprolyl isomerase n=1 Tax=Anguilla anguilla TaxID=7936 RepID=A0A0E9WPQ9_ANGAN|nr:peptidyl-prolyl cis-trans isomerase FKBP7 [Anguilla anguilla]KAG5852565.1 hypothetical protein ANANG_G00063770 [Anguilla anguilla]
MGFAVRLFLCLHVCSFFVDFTVANETKDEVKIEVIFKPENCAKKSKRGDLMNAHYDGFLAKNGSQFYCSRSEKDGHPKWFVLGVGQVMKGLDIGMDGMCPGEKRKLIIPPSLGYGQQGNEKVPPNSTLIFEIELYSVSRGPRSMEAFREMDLDKDRSLSKTEVKKSLMIEYEKGGTRRDDSFYDAIIADIFHKSDHNGDGMISAKEYNIYDHDEL